MNQTETVQNIIDSNQQRPLSESEDQYLNDQYRPNQQIPQRSNHINRARNYFTNLSSNPFNSVFYQKFGFVVLILTGISTAIGYFQQCKQNHHDFLLCWGLFYILTFGKYKSSLIMNLFLFIWGNSQLFIGDHCSILITINIIFILLTNIQFYLLGIIIAISFIAVFVLCLFCVLKIRNAAQSHKKNKQQAQRSIIKNEQIDPQIQCSICFQNKLNCKLKCGHLFHQNCIKNWIENKINCPVCRAQLY